MKKNIIMAFVIIMGLTALGYLRWRDEINNTVFECRAKFHSIIPADVCQGKTDYNLFLSMPGNGSGYLIVLGTYSCINKPPVLVDTKVDFTYKKEGGYYALQFGKRPEELSRLIKVFKYEGIKVKIRKMDVDDYLIYFPFEAPFFCKKD